MTEQERTEIEAATFRRLLTHLDDNKEIFMSLFVVLLLIDPHFDLRRVYFDTD